MNNDDIEMIAAIAHESNRTYCMAIDDNSQPSWDEAPDWQKESTFSGVRSIIDNPNTTPEISHMGWLKHKVNDGWKYGETKDPEAKTHPCMVAYEDLPESQKVKNIIFTTTVKTMIRLYLEGSQ